MLILIVLLVGCATVPPLTKAVIDGDLVTFDKLLREGANINEANSGKTGTTTLGWALAGCKFDIASVLLTKGVNVNMTDVAGTPIWFAAFSCNNMDSYFTKRLLEQVLDVNIQDKQGYTIWAYLNYNQDGIDNVFKLLIDKGLNVNSKEGIDSPLIYATRQNSPKAVKLLLDEGANINAMGLWRTALMDSAYYNHPQVAKLLIERGADIHIYDKRGDRNAMAYTHYRNFYSNSVADVLRNADRIRQQYLANTKHTDSISTKPSINTVNKPPATAPKFDIDDGIEKIKNQIAKQVKVEGVKSLAILDFTDIRGKDDLFGRYLSEKLIIALFNLEGITVVERSKLHQVLSEHERQQMGLIDPKTTKKIGQFLGIDALMIGTVNDIGDTLEVNGRLVHAETARILAVTSFSFIKDIKVEMLYRQGQGTPTVTGPKEIGRDGRFIAYSNGTVLDTRTNLMWAARDNGSDISWANAKSYYENYRGGGYTDWRMPTQDELAGLYDNSKSYKATQRDYNVHLSGLIQLSTCCPLASSTKRSSQAASVSFRFGDVVWLWMNPSSGDFSNYRALPVRSGK